MQITIGQYVTGSLGEIYRVNQSDGSGELLITNIVTQRTTLIRSNKVKPLWLQAGDEVSITYGDGNTIEFHFDTVLYDEDNNDYQYVLYNPDIPNEILNSEEIVNYINGFI